MFHNFIPKILHLESGWMHSVFASEMESLLMDVWSALNN